MQFFLVLRPLVPEALLFYKCGFYFIYLRFNTFRGISLSWLSATQVPESVHLSSTICLPTPKDFSLFLSYGTSSYPYFPFFFHVELLKSLFYCKQDLLQVNFTFTRKRYTIWKFDPLKYSSTQNSMYQPILNRSGGKVVFVRRTYFVDLGHSFLFYRFSVKINHWPVWIQSVVGRKWLFKGPRNFNELWNQR